MGKNINEQPTNTLIYAQQMIDLSSREMRDFFGQVIEDRKNGLVSQTYHDELEKNLHARVVKNNDITDEIEKELHRRIEKDFPGVTTSRLMTVFASNWKAEKSKQEKLVKAEASAEKPVINLKKSKEKKV